MAIIKSLEKEEAEDLAKQVYEKFEKETGKVPEWVKVMAHNPKIVKEFTELFKVVMQEGEIEPALKWKIAYVVSETLKCPFCVDVTSKMLKTLGAPEKLEELEEDILKFVKEITLKANITEPSLYQKMKNRFSEKELIEILSIICLFNYINRFNNTLAVLPQ